MQFEVEEITQNLRNCQHYDDDKEQSTKSDKLSWSVTHFCVTVIDTMLEVSIGAIYLHATLHNFFK